MRRPTREETAIAGCFIAALLSSLAVASIGWSHAISDAYGWRQTQTAISAYFMGQGGPWLDYETPVLGPPWQLPHEFPLYQWLVAALAWLTPLPLEPAGRAVSLALFYASVSLVYLLLAELGVSRRHRLLALACWLVSPLYLFWSRTFMIESTALFLSVAHLTFAVRYLNRAHVRDAVVALLAGCLAFAVKPPTLLPFVCLAGAAWALQMHRVRYRPTANLAVCALVLALPLVVGRTWHQHADGLKMLNPFGWAWASDAMWRDWILSPPGTHASPELRIDPEAWSILWIRTIPGSVGHLGVVVAAAAGILVAGRRRVLFGLAVMAFLFHFVAFMPLHLSHAYYEYAMGLFLVGAVAFSAVALLEAGGRRRYLAWLIVGLLAISCAHVYRTTLLPLQRNDAYRRAWFTRLAAALAERTRPSDVIVGFGLDWNPEVPYYAKRRALMWPGWGDLRADGKDVTRALAQLEGWRVGALFNCADDTPQDVLALFRSRLGIQDSPDLELPSWSVGGPVGSTREPTRRPKDDRAGRHATAALQPSPKARSAARKGDILSLCDG